MGAEERDSGVWFGYECQVDYLQRTSLEEKSSKTQDVKVTTVLFADGRKFMKATGMMNERARCMKEVMDK